MDHPTFLFDLCGVERESVGPVVEHQQATVKFLLTDGCRDVVDVIDRLFDARIGIHTVIGTHTLEETVHTVPREMLTAIEAHMLQEMGQSPLVVLFLQTTHALRQIETRPVLWPVVVLDIIGEAIGEVSDPHR